MATEQLLLLIVGALALLSLLLGLWLLLVSNEQRREISRLRQLLAGEEEEPVETVVELTKRFANTFQDKVGDWRRRVQDAVELGPVVLWGSGSKAVAFLAAVHPVSEAVEHVVDINPHRHGFYMPGTGQQILSPDELVTVAPRTVIAMNPVYRQEIAADLEARGIEADLVTL